MRLLEIPVQTLEEEIAALQSVGGFREEALMANGAIIALTALLRGSASMSQLLAAQAKLNAQLAH